MYYLSATPVGRPSRHNQRHTRYRHDRRTYLSLLLLLLLDHLAVHQVVLLEFGLVWVCCVRDIRRQGIDQSTHTYTPHTNIQNPHAPPPKKKTALPRSGGGPGPGPAGPGRPRGAWGGVPGPCPPRPAPPAPLSAVIGGGGVHGLVGGWGSGVCEREM